jgi:hypothetical protein
MDNRETHVREITGDKSREKRSLCRAVTRNGQLARLWG